MNEASLFTHIDTAVRVIALIALCLFPFLLPWPQRLTRALTGLRQRLAHRPALGRS